jgi:hypothetical protein
MKYADRLPITVARFAAQDSLRVFPIPGSTRIAITSRVTLAIEELLKPRRLARRGHGSFLVDLATAENGPGDARHFVGERDRDEPHGFVRE